MSELSPGDWQPWDLGGGRHQCRSHQTRENEHSRRRRSADISGVETYLTRCPWCRSHVYYHTNGNGDCVYFDQLGYPWQVHPCWHQHWKTVKARDRVLQDLQLANRRMHQQRLLLLGVIHRICGAGLGNAGKYPVKEITIARKLEISLEQLKKEFGYLYTTDSDGIRVLGLPNKNNLKIVAINPPQSSPGHFDSLGFERERCPHCDENKIKSRIEDHIQVCKYAGLSPKKKEIMRNKEQEQNRKEQKSRKRSKSRYSKNSRRSAS